MASSKHPGHGEPLIGGRNVKSGSHLGEPWVLLQAGEKMVLMISGRPVDIERDARGTYVTHQLFGRWPSPDAIAVAILSFHPDFSPRARKKNFPNV